MINNRKDNKVSLFAVILLVVAMIFSNLASVNVYAQTLDGESSLTAQSLEINYEEDNVSYYQVYFSPYENFTSFSLQLEFPSFITVENVLTNYQLGADNDGFVGNMTSPYAGQYTCDFQDNIVSVALTSIEQNGYSRLFTVAIKATENITQTGEVIVREMQFLDFNDNVLDVNVELGDITVNKQRTAKMGDVDGNNVVNMIDLITIQRSITDLSGDYALSEEQQVLADINCDGVVDIKDCQIIRKYLVGLVESLDGYVSPVYEYYNVDIYLTDLNGNARHENTVTLVKGTNVLDFLMEYAYSNGINVETWYSDRWCMNEIRADLTLFVDLTAYGVQESIEPEPELPPAETPSSYWVSVSYYGENGFTESAGMFEIPAGTYLVSYLRQIASGFGTELYNVYTNGSMQEPIDEYMTVDEYVNQYGQEVWVTFNNGENGDGGNGGNGDEAREFTLSFYVNGVHSGSQRATAGENVLSVVNNWYVYDTAGEIIGVYYDMDRTLIIDEVETVDCDRDVYIFTSNFNIGGDTQIHQLSIYKNTSGGGWEQIGQLDLQDGEYIYEALRRHYQAEFVYFEGIYFDSEMTMPVGQREQIKGYTEIYIYTSENNEPTTTYTITIFGRTIDSEWNFFGSAPAQEGQYIHDVLRNFMGEQIDYVDIFYDADMTSTVCYGESVCGDLTVYIYINEQGGGNGGEVGKNDMLFVSLINSDGDQVDFVQIPAYDGLFIKDAIRNQLSIKNDFEVYMDDEDRTPVTDSDVYTQGSFNNFVVMVQKFTVFFCYEPNVPTMIVDMYSFSGDVLKLRLDETIMKYCPQFNVERVYSNVELSEEISFEMQLYSDYTVYAKVYKPQYNDSYLHIEIVESIAGTLQNVGGYSVQVEQGDNIMQIVNQRLEEYIGSMYVFKGLYYDEQCTNPVGEYEAIVSGYNRVYLLREAISLVGSYQMFSMEGELIGTLTLQEGDSAIVIIDEVPYTGIWFTMHEMIFVSVGEYSQYICAMVDMGEGPVMMAVSAVNGENKPAKEELKDIAGRYVYYDSYHNESGEEIVEEYYMYLFDNGIYEMQAYGIMMRGEYERVYNNIVSLYVMGDTENYTLDVENKIAYDNYLIDYVGTHDITESEYTEIGHNYQVVGSFTVNIDGTATFTLYGETKECRAEAISGELYLLYGDYGYVKISYYGENGTWAYFLVHHFNGNDYVVDSAYTPCVGEFLYTRYEQKLKLVFFENGVFKETDSYDGYRMGSYEVCDGYLILYYERDKGVWDEIAYSEQQGAYVLRHLLEQEGGSETEDPKFDVIGGIGYN